MNTEQAKHISLPNLLSKLGYEPIKVTKEGRELWYQSPFRAEKEASFHTSYLRGKWIWNDFGDTGGTVIDFVMRYKNYSRVKDALDFLTSLYQPDLFQPTKSPSFSFQQQDDRVAVENFSADRQLELIEAHSIKSRAILSYLAHERAIPAELARQYLLEVKYRNLAVGKNFFGFGMVNESGGYEVRVALPNNNFKSAIKARDISVIRGSSQDNRSVSLFEGMTDFLSLLVMQGKKQLSEDAIVMHSLSSHGRTVAYLREHPYQEIKIYFDNNPAGQKGTAKLQSELGQNVISYSNTFAPYVDLNDALRAIHRRAPRTRSS